MASAVFSEYLRAKRVEEELAQLGEGSAGSTQNLLRSLRSLARAPVLAVGAAHGVLLGREGELADAGVHAVHLDHLIDHPGDAAEVVAGAGGDAPEDDLLGGAAGERHADNVVDLRLGAQEHLLGQVLREAERAGGAGHNRHLHERVSVLQEPARHSVAGLVVRHDVLLGVRDEPASERASEVRELVEGGSDHGLG
jgi:hypothetical protein